MLTKKQIDEILNRLNNGSGLRFSDSSYIESLQIELDQLKASVAEVRQFCTTIVEQNKSSWHTFCPDEDERLDDAKREIRTEIAKHVLWMLPKDGK